MSKDIKAWEELPNGKKGNAFITRIDTSDWGILYSDSNYVLGRIRYTEKQGYYLYGNSCRYYATVETLVQGVGRLGAEYLETTPQTLKNCLKTTIKANLAAMQLAEHLKEVINDTRKAS